MGDYPVTLDMVSGRVGSTITVPLLWSEGGVAIDLTGWEARVQVRDVAGAPVMADLTSGDGDIVLNDPENGVVIIKFGEAHTTAIGDGDWNFDIRLNNADSSQIVYLAEAVLRLKTPYTQVP